jgi:hypothetical protein
MDHKISDVLKTPVNDGHHVKIEFLAAVTVKEEIFWDVMPFRISCRERTCSDDGCIKVIT